MPSQAPGKKTPLIKRINKITYGELAVNIEIFPVTTTPRQIHKYTTA